MVPRKTSWRLASSRRRGSLLTLDTIEISDRFRGSDEDDMLWPVLRGGSAGSFPRNPSSRFLSASSTEVIALPPTIPRAARSRVGRMICDDEAVDGNDGWMISLQQEVQHQALLARRLPQTQRKGSPGCRWGSVRWQKTVRWQRRKLTRGPRVRETPREMVGVVSFERKKDSPSFAHSTVAMLWALRSLQSNGQCYQR